MVVVTSNTNMVLVRIGQFLFDIIIVLLITRDGCFIW